MSVLGDVLAGLRKVLVLEHRLQTLASEIERLSQAHTETRERLIRLEVIIDEARRRGASQPGTERQITGS